VQIRDFTNLYGCEIGDDVKIGTFVEIQKGVRVGSRCKISSHTFICSGVTIEDEVFIGHGVMFTNDLYPGAVNVNGEPQTESDWELLPTLVRQRASLGSNATILAGVTVGRNAIVGAGAVVTKDVPDHALVVGTPARQQGWVCVCAQRLTEKLRCPACAREYVAGESGLVSRQP
jgi:acetyltransferase-like isoleucine patch superfamily enzyme